MSHSEKKIGREEISFYYDEMVRSNLVELEIETPNGKLVLKRSRKEDENSYRGLPPLRRKTDFLPLQEKNGSIPVSGYVVSSPITGVFYRSPSPQSPAFVKEGESLDAGSTLCIVEAMKVMNEIKAEKRCRIVKILAENGKPVNSGQALFHAELL